jgi:hypothetical protein
MSVVVKIFGSRPLTDGHARRRAVANLAAASRHGDRKPLPIIGMLYDRGLP